MSIKTAIFLFFTNVVIVSCVAYFQSSPGYMDADYYFATGVQLARGEGLWEPFIWNYLDDIYTIPHPSHAYWMPLASFISALGIIISGISNFSGAKIPFLFLAGFIPILCMCLAYQFSKNWKHAALAGAISCLPGLYLPYLGVTDTFVVYMLLGGLWLYVVNYDVPHIYSQYKVIALGLISGLLHLARADGVIWLFVSLFYIVNNNLRSPEKHLRNLFLSIIFCLLGYLLIMAPWMVRNFSTFGTLLSPGGLKTLWLAEYNEFFSYPSDYLTPVHWYSQGLLSIGSSILTAVWQNFQTLFVVQGSIVLFPLIIIGIWQLRHKSMIIWGLVGWILTFISMTFVFPYTGWRGGFFHSGSATQILFWAVVPVGLETFCRWGARIRKWDPQYSFTIYKTALVIILLFLSIFAIERRVIGANLHEPVWDISSRAYYQIENILAQYDDYEIGAVIVNNPPGYYIVSGRNSLVLPHGDISSLLKVRDLFKAKYLIIDENHPTGLKDLYYNPGTRKSLYYLGEFQDHKLYKFQ